MTEILELHFFSEGLPAFYLLIKNVEKIEMALCYSITLISLFFSYRSACYFTLKQYQACLTDIALALEAGYPTHMIYKLYIRKCKCLLELCRIPDAQEAFDKAIDAIDRSGLKKDLRKVCINYYYFL